MVPMQLSEFTDRMVDLLRIPEFEKIDVALNGLQVSRRKKEVHKVALAVDASMAAFQRAAGAQADLLFVHHGLFWGKPMPVEGNLYARLKYLMDKDLALFAAHLPLDTHPELGNNIGLARLLGLQGIEGFGEYRGIRIGWKGSLAHEKTIEEIENLVCGTGGSCLGALPFGPEKIRTVGIVSGGLPKAAGEAISEGLDLFITGDSSHEIYHECLEAGISVLFAGHYNTETWGIKALKKHMESWEGLDTVMIDAPTGL